MARCEDLHAAFALRSGLEGARESASPRRAFGLALAGTASNPATIISWAALFAAANSTASVHGTRGAVLLVAGVCVGSLSWVSILASVTAATRRLIGPRAMRAADCLAGTAMLGFGGALAYSTVRER